MAQAKLGDTVKVHYTGSLSDGTVFDSSADRDPLEFTLGQNQVIPGFENNVVGMDAGESKSIEVPADEAYGPHQKELMIELGREHIPENVEIEVNQQLQLVREDGQAFVVRVADFSDSTVTLDANHPLAGEELSFNLQLVEIMPSE